MVNITKNKSKRHLKTNLYIILLEILLIVDNNISFNKNLIWIDIFGKLKTLIKNIDKKT